MRIEQLSKKYGKKVVVNHVSLSLEKTAYGLLGPNGAGKTTLLRLLAGVIQADQGRIAYSAGCKRIGYLPQKFGCFPELTVYEQMEYFSCLKKISAAKRKNEIKKALRMVHLDDMVQMKCKKLSGGMIRRIGIAQAIMGQPDLILFDEPTVGLDVEERIRFTQVVQELSGKTTVLLSTHLVEDVKSVCRKVIIMNRGVAVSAASAAETAGKADGRVYVVKQQELHQVVHPYYVERCETIDDTMYARILTEEKPQIEYSECIPDLEDGYFWVIKMENEEKV